MSKKLKPSPLLIALGNFEEALDQVVEFLPEDCLPHTDTQAEQFDLIKHSLFEVGSLARYYSNVCSNALQEWEGETYESCVGED